MIQSREAPAQVELRVIAQAQIVLGDLKAAEAAILRAIELGGAKDAEVADDLVKIRRHMRLEALRNELKRHKVLVQFLKFRTQLKIGGKLQPPTLVSDYS